MCFHKNKSSNIFRYSSKIEENYIVIILGGKAFINGVIMFLEDFQFR